MARVDYVNDPNAPKANSIVPSVTAFARDEAGQVLLIHRTDNRESFTDTRYAIETWFFAPSAYPVPDPGKKQARPQVPLVY